MIRAVTGEKEGGVGAVGWGSEGAAPPRTSRGGRGRRAGGTASHRDNGGAVTPQHMEGKKGRKKGRKEGGKGETERRLEDDTRGGGTQYTCRQRQRLIVLP